MIAIFSLYHKKNRRSHNGFSLLELLVSLVLLALMAALLSAGLYVSIRWGKSSFNRNVNTHISGILSHRAITQILKRTMPLKVAQGGDGKRVVFEGDENEISLVAFSPFQSFKNSLYAIRLKIVSLNGQSEIVRITATELDTGLNRRDRGGSHSSDLPIGQNRFKFSFFGRPDGHDVAGWQTKWTQQSELPEMVRFSAFGHAGTEHDAQLQWHFYLPLDWAPRLDVGTQK